MKKTKSIATREEDIQAKLKALPKIAPGEYGAIHGIEIDTTYTGEGWRVKRVEFFSKEVLNRARKLNPLFKYHYFYRRELAKKSTKPFIMRGFGSERGPFQVAIVRHPKDGLVALPLALVQEGLREDQFTQFLQVRGRSKSDFIQESERIAAIDASGSEKRQAILFWLEKKPRPEVPRVRKDS